MIFKLRIISESADEAELLRQALRAAFGDHLTLGTAHPGRNPKYADRPQFLAYGELEFTRAELEAAAGQARTPPTPSTAGAPTTRLGTPRAKRRQP